MAYLNIWDTIDQIVLLKAYKPNVISLLIFSRHAVHNSEISGQWRRNEFKSGGGTGPAPSAGKKILFFFGHVPPPFGSKNTISRFGERFRVGQYSLVSFLFTVFLLTAPHVD